MGAREALQSIDDIVRIAANQASFGLADRLEGEGAAERTAAARARTGIGGDAASAIGTGLGPGLAIRGVKALYSGAKALPALVKGGAGGLGTAAKVLAGATGLGLATAVNTSNRTNAAFMDKVPQPAKPARSASGMNPVSAEAAKAIASARKQAEPKPMFEDLIARVAAGQEGMVSLRQLGAISEAAQRGAAANTAGQSKSAPKPGDAAAAMLEKIYVNQLNNRLADPNADPAAAQDEFEQKVLQLRKTQFNNPYGVAEG